MPIYLDEQAAQFSAENLGDALDAAQQQLASCGRIVVEVRLGDQTLDSEQIHADLMQSLDGRDLHLYSANPRELSIHTLQEVRDHLAQAKQLQDDAAQGLQRDDIPQALELLAQAVDTWLGAQQAVVHIAALLTIDLETLTVQSEPAVTIIEGLLDPLRTLKALIAAHDTVALADALAYEWPPLVDRWDALLVELIQQCQLPQE